MTPLAIEEGPGNAPDVERAWLASADAERKLVRRGAYTLLALTLVGAGALGVGTVVALHQQRQLQALERQRTRLEADLRDGSQELAQMQDQLSEAREGVRVASEDWASLRQNVAELTRARDELLASIDQGHAEQTAAAVRTEIAAKERAPDGHAQARALWKKGYDAFNAGDMKAARGYYEASHKKDATYAPAVTSLGRLTEDKAEKKRLFESAIKLQPSYVPAVHNLAVWYFDAGQYPAARKQVNRALQLNRAYDLSRDLDAKLKKLGY